MKLSERTIQALGKVITGDGKKTPYRSGPELVRLFNEYGDNTVYGKGFPSRWMHAEAAIRRLNGNPILAKLIEEVLDLRNFFETGYSADEAVNGLDQYLRYDGYTLIKVAGEQIRWEVRSLKGKAIPLDHPVATQDEFIAEQIKKCERKMAEGDYDGAITNARSMLEAVLTEVERELDEGAPKYDGDLIKLYRRVQKLLNLEPKRADIAETLKQILSGLVSIVNGLAGMRNKMSDSHARSYRPQEHHAWLAVNGARTVARFILETKEYQVAKLLGERI